MEQVTLTVAELHLAAGVGVQRHIEALRQRRPDRYGAEKDAGWSLHIEGAAGEMAVAKALGTFWGATVNTYKEGGDIGSRIQVRTRSRHDYELIIRDSDRDDDVFVLVTGRSPSFTIRGWTFGHTGKKPEWMKTHGARSAAFFVPHGALWPLERLREGMARGLVG